MLYGTLYNERGITIYILGSFFNEDYLIVGIDKLLHP